MSNAQAQQTGGGEDAESLERQTNRKSNIKELDGKIHRRFRLNQIALASLGLSFVVLIVAIINGTRIIIVGSICLFILLTTLFVRNRRQITRLEKLRGEIIEAYWAAETQRENFRRQREGIRKRQDYDVVVDPSEWQPEFNQSGTEWVEGEIRQLLPGDTVLRFAWQVHPLIGRGGFAVERNGKIIAEHYTWIS
jgi:hypothetical protein